MKVIYKPTEENLDELSPDINYLVLTGEQKTSSFLFQNYKTVKKYGTQRIAVPSSIIPSILDYLHSRPDFKDDKMVWLFQKDDGKAYSSNTLTNVVSRAMVKMSGKKVNPHLFRTIFLTNFNRKARSVREKEKITKLLATSVEEAELSYTKM